jgi:hypothetical protein
MKSADPLPTAFDEKAAAHIADPSAVETNFTNSCA